MVSMKMANVKRKKNRRKGMWMVWGVILLVVLVVGITVGKGNRKPEEMTEEKSEKTENQETEPASEDTEQKDINIAQCDPGTVVEKDRLDFEHIDKYFTVENISEEVAEDMQGKSYRENPDVNLEDLRYLKVLHYNFDHDIQVGELVVNASVAEDCREIFLELFEQEYEIKSMYRVDRFYGEDGDGESADCNSINQDNTSGFNYRLINGTDRLSNHAFGCAIDINPMENPTMAVSRQDRKNGKYLHWEEYSNRTEQKPHMIQKGDVCYEIFIKHGFVWGGEWDGSPDYQHFEKEITK